MLEQPGSVKELFDALALALKEDRCEDFVHVLDLPASLMVGTGQVYLENHTEAAAYMRQYRKNMLVQGYAKTVASVVADDAMPDGRRRVLVHWHHFNRNDAVFREVHASYGVRRQPDGAWSVSDVELVDDVPDRLAFGLTIVPTKT